MIICFGTYAGHSWSDMNNHVFLVVAAVAVVVLNAIINIVSIDDWHIQHMLLVFTIT